MIAKGRVLYWSVGLLLLFLIILQMAFVHKMTDKGKRQEGGLVKNVVSDG